MKKIFILLALFLFCVSPVFAQEEPREVTPIPYALPYPGLLPDSPFYILKTVRDRITGFLISDTLKKAEFDLALADKRLSTGMYLFKKGKVDLAESVISKGENYFEDALKRAEEARKQGMHIDEVGAAMYDASQKHKEVVQDLAKKAEGEHKEKFAVLEQRVSTLEKKASEIKPNK